MVARRTVIQIVVTLLCGLVATVGLVQIDDAATRTALREAGGYYRGEFLDRNNTPLALTRLTGAGARRTYVVPSLAQATGYRDIFGRWHGLEQRYNSFLSGSRARADWRTFFLHLRGIPARGGSVRLTLDRTLQEAADRAMGSIQGAAVAIDPATGGVLALVDKPYCAPVQLASRASYSKCLRGPSQPMRDRALGTLYSPGSSFKIVTLTAAIDSGKFRLQSVFSGPDAFGPSPYFDNHVYPSNVTRADLTQLTLAQALAFSDNFTFAHIGLTLGASTLLHYAHLYRVGRRIPFALPTTPSVIANGNAHPSLSELAQSSFGAEVDRVSPLQMAMIAATVANRGVLMAPHIVDALITSSRTVSRRYRLHTLARVMRKTSADQVRTGMEFVVEHGSGFRAQIPGIKVAGKTGTAASGSSKPNAWFICFAPADHPVIAVAVLHELSGEGFKFAAPIARRIMVAALREHGYNVR